MEKFNRIESILLDSVVDALEGTLNTPEEKAAVLTALIRMSTSLAIGMGVERRDFVGACSDLYQDESNAAVQLGQVKHLEAN